MNLREFVALHYERHPEIMRTVPWLRPAGRDSASGASGASGCVFQSAVTSSTDSDLNLPLLRLKFRFRGSRDETHNFANWSLPPQK